MDDIASDEAFAQVLVRVQAILDSMSDEMILYPIYEDFPGPRNELVIQQALSHVKDGIARLRAPSKRYWVKL